MNPNDVDPILKQTLTDRRVSASEKNTMKQWIATEVDSEQDRAFVRHRAFEIAKAELTDSTAREVIDWLEEVNKILSRSETVPPGIESNAFFSPGDECFRAIQSEIRSAKKTVDICVFTITDDRITEVIMKAHQRGVVVRIISDDEKSFDPGSDIARLKQAGIETKIDHDPGHMHHKFALLDRQRLLTGSFNWTRSATEANAENILITTDPRLVIAFQNEFDSLWKFTRS